jgi:hypothetical protein
LLGENFEHVGHRIIADRELRLGRNWRYKNGDGTWCGSPRFQAGVIVIGGHERARRAGVIKIRGDKTELADHRRSECRVKVLDFVSEPVLRPSVFGCLGVPLDNFEKREVLPGDAAPARILNQNAPDSGTPYDSV